jgi:hypothetical protein
MAAKGPWPCLSGFDRPGFTAGDASLSSAFFEGHVETLAAALIAASLVVDGIGGRARPPPFRLHECERLSTAVVGPRTGEVAVGASLSVRP